jgi:hypothetical protein
LRQWFPKCKAWNHGRKEYNYFWSKRGRGQKEEGHFWAKGVPPPRRLRHVVYDTWLREWTAVGGRGWIRRSSLRSRESRSSVFLRAPKTRSVRFRTSDPLRASIKRSFCRTRSSRQVLQYKIVEFFACCKQRVLTVRSQLYARTCLQLSMYDTSFCLWFSC